MDGRVGLSATREMRKIVATRRRAARVERQDLRTHPSPTSQPMRLLAAFSIALMTLAPATARAQAAHEHDHGAPSAPAEPGQSAFAAIAEIVRTLDADPATDWGRADVERLRAHLRDMDDVTLRAEERRDDVPGGARFSLRGTGRTVGAIQRMARAHAAM